MKKLAWISASLAICVALAGCSTVKEEKKDTTSNAASSAISEEADSSSEEEETVDFSTIEYPDSYDEFEWPDVGIGSTLPAPKTIWGIVGYDTNDEFWCYVGKVTKSDYRAYVKECWNAGFQNDYTKTDQAFTAFDSSDSELTIYYYDYQMAIRVASINSDTISKNWDKEDIPINSSDSTVSEND